MPYYAIIYQGKCVGKIVWDGVTPYECPYLYDELVLDEKNEIPVANGDEPTPGSPGEAE